MDVDCWTDNVRRATDLSSRWAAGMQRLELWSHYSMRCYTIWHTSASLPDHIHVPAKMRTPQFDFTNTNTGTGAPMARLRNVIHWHSTNLQAHLRWLLPFLSHDVPRYLKLQRHKCNAIL